jgi:hypothetical protein
MAMVLAATEMGPQRPSSIHPDFIAANVPAAGGDWRLRCPECEAALTFSFRDRGTGRAVLVVAHGEGAATRRLEVAPEGRVMWAVGLADPLTRWIDYLHDEGGE